MLSIIILKQSFFMKCLQDILSFAMFIINKMALVPRPKAMKCMTNNLHGMTMVSSNTLLKNNNIHNEIKKQHVSKYQIQSLSSNNITLNNSTNYIKKKIDDLVTKYEQITGMDEVRVAQNRVIEAQDKFISAQERRRAVVKELASIQNKLKEVYAELDATTRGEERYLNLVTKEHNLLKEEKRLTAQFNLSEREERECFTFLSSAVKESHEKERAQAERTKYWSVIGSVLGTVIGVIGSSINNEFKMRELRKLVVESAAHSQRSAEVDDMAAAILTRHEEQLSQIVSEIKSISHGQQPASSNVLSRMILNVDHPTGETPLHVLLEEQKRETRLVLGFAIIVIPIVVACMNKML